MSRIPDQVYTYDSDDKHWKLLEEKNNPEKPLKDISKRKLKEFLSIDNFKQYIKMVKSGADSSELNNFIQNVRKDK